MAKHNLYLIHGWGMNKAVWQPLLSQIESLFNIHLLDLPGYGDSHQTYPSEYSLANISEQIANQIKQPGILLGWSLGGLVAQHIAIHQPQTLTHLVCLASTPKFQAELEWRGIKPEVLTTFQQQLANDYHKTIERFLAIQAMGSDTARQDVKQLKNLLMQYQTPCEPVLAAGLNILAQADLRAELNKIQTPTIRFYGKLDSLVPIKAADAIAQLQPEAKQITFAKASHAPFISHATQFSQAMLAEFSN